MARRDDLLSATRSALALWAAMNHSELPGWYTKSSFYAAINGRGGGPTPMSAVGDIVESAVNYLYKAEPESRRMILLHYLANGSCRAKIKHLKVSAREYYLRLERAEYAVKIYIGY